MIASLNANVDNNNGEGVALNGNNSDDKNASGDNTNNESKNSDKQETKLVQIIRNGNEVSSHGTLGEALQLIESGDTIKLLNNVDLGKGSGVTALTISGMEFTIDLAGYKIKSTGYNSVLLVDEGTELTIKDTSENSTGELDCYGGNSTIRTKGKLTIDGGTYRSLDIAGNRMGYYSLFMLDGNKETIINNGVFDFGIFTNGKSEDAGKFTINDGIFTEILYLAGNGGEFINNSGDAFVMANEAKEETSCITTIEIGDAKVEGNIAYYGLKGTDSEEKVQTNNNIVLKGLAAENNTITFVDRGGETKETEDDGSIKYLGTRETYTITWIGYDGNTLTTSNNIPYGSIPVYSGDTPTKPSEGSYYYEFKGWDPEIQKVTDNAVYKATFTEKKIQSSGGSSSKVRKYEIKVSQATGGMISPTKANVVRGDEKTFTIDTIEGYELLEVIVDGKSVGKVNEYTFENVKADHTITANFRKIEELVEVNFDDVKSEDWFYEAVKYTAERKIFNGLSETEFGPNVQTTRGMIVTLLYRLSNEDYAGNTQIFTDVASSSYYEKAIAWAYSKGIVNGLGDDIFAPEKAITREELATII